MTCVFANVGRGECAALGVVVVVMRRRGEAIGCDAVERVLRGAAGLPGTGMHLHKGRGC